MNKVFNKSNFPNRKKLLNSKWTATKPVNKEKHFIISKVKLDDDDSQIIEFVILTAVFTNMNYKMSYRDLQNVLYWEQGWN